MSHLHGRSGRQTRGPSPDLALGKSGRETQFGNGRIRQDAVDEGLMGGFHFCCRGRRRCCRRCRRRRDVLVGRRVKHSVSHGGTAVDAGKLKLWFGVRWNVFEMDRTLTEFGVPSNHRSQKLLIDRISFSRFGEFGYRTFAELWRRIGPRFDSISGKVKFRFDGDGSRSFLDDGFAVSRDDLLGAAVQLRVLDQTVAIREPGAALKTAVSFFAL